MISGKLAEVYAKIEDKFYAGMDFLDDKGLPVYKIVDLFENRGIPFFPVFIALIAIILFILLGFFYFNFAAANVSIAMNIVDDEGKGLSGAMVSVKNETGKTIYGPEPGSNGGAILLEGIPIGSTVTVEAEKEGFKKDSELLDLDSVNVTANLFLERMETGYINGKLRFIDSEKDTAIEGVLVTASWKAEVRNAVSGGDGIAELVNLPKKEEILVEVTADSYEDLSQKIRFESTELRTISLAPKPAELQGETNLIVKVFDSETKSLVEGANIRIFDGESFKKLDESEEDDDGIYSSYLKKGTVVMVSVEKDGYVRYEDSEEEFVTLRGEETVKEIFLEKGGEQFTVAVMDEDTKTLLHSAEVTLYGLENKVLETKETGFGGFVEFGGLNVNEKYFIGAVKEGYLPKVIEVIPLAQESADIELKKATIENSAELIVHAITSGQKPAVNATLQFYELKGEEQEEFPLGLGIASTGLDGSHETTMEAGKNIRVKGFWKLEKGEAQKTIEPELNELIIQLKVPDTVKTLVLKDENGNVIEDGNVLVSAKDGTVLFDGPIEEGSVVFDSIGYNEAVVEVSLPDGTTHSELRQIGKNRELEMELNKEQHLELKPKIRLARILDEDGNEVKGIVKGKDYYLEFETQWIEGEYKGGMHVRVGNDTVPYIESDTVGVTGFDAVADNFFFGQTYQPFPSPGNESIDRRNEGEAGEFSKFLELYFENPGGTKIVRARVKAREGFGEESFEVNYRTWAEFNGLTARTPEDQVLGSEKVSREKSALYAETISEKVSVFESEPLCKEKLCITHMFLTKEGGRFGEKEFSAGLGEVYALEAEMVAAENLSVNLRVSTSDSVPKVVFTSYSLSGASNFADNENPLQALTANNISLSRGTPKTARFYFKGIKEGEAFIRSEAKLGNEGIEDELFFAVFREAELDIELEDFVNAGEEIKITLKDSLGRPVENAKIRIISADGETAAEMLGDGSTGNGRDGVYRFKNSLEPGKYAARIEAPGFRPVEKGFMVGAKEGLKIEEKILLNMPFGEKVVRIEETIRNTLTLPVSGIAAEVVPAKNWPDELILSALPPAELGPRETGKIGFTAEYTGNEEKIVHGEADVEFTGLVNGEYVVAAKTRVKVNYNQRLKESCLEFDSSELQAYLVGAEGNRKTLDILMKNNCGVPLNFSPEALPKGKEAPGVEVYAGTFRLEADGKPHQYSLELVSTFPTMFDLQQQYNYDVFFKSPQISKSIPLKIILWNPKIALFVPDNLHIWITQSQRQKTGIGRAMLFISNRGNADVSEITMALEQHIPGVDVKIEPRNEFPLLKKGQSIPPAYVVATANTEKSSTHLGNLVINGNIEGRHYTNLWSVPVYFHVSDWHCLSLQTLPGEPLNFETDTKKSFEAITRFVSIKNFCQEPVVIGEMEPKYIGNNYIEIYPDGEVLPPQTGRDDFELTVYPSESIDVSRPVSVLGVGQVTRELIKSEPVNISLKVGESATSCSGGKCRAMPEIEVPICEDRDSETKKISFPKLSTDCHEGYCDAQGMAGYIAKKAKDKIVQAKRRVTELANTTLNVQGCDPRQGYCTFESMNIQADSLEVFLSHDNLSREMLKKEIDDLKSSEFENFDVRYGEGDFGVAGIGLLSRIYIPGDLAGCGRYKLTTTGAVGVEGDRLDTESIVVVFRLVDADETPECKSVAQNAPNFLPLDKKYNSESAYESWLTMVDGKDSSTKKFEEKFAEKLFGKSEGRLGGGGSRNTVELELGEVPFNGLMKIEVKPGFSAENPKKVYVTVSRKSVEASESVEGGEDKLIEETARILGNLWNSKLGDACISRDESFFVVSSAERVEEFVPRLEVPGSMQVSMQETCVNGVLSNLSSGEFDLVFDEDSAKIPGLEYIEVWDASAKQVKTTAKTAEKTEAPKEGEEAKTGEKIVWEYERKGEKPAFRLTETDRDFTVNLAKFDKASKRYYYHFQLCIRGGADFQEATEKSIKLKAEDLHGPYSMEEFREIDLMLCGLTPLEFLEEAYKTPVGEEPYYATLVWDGGDDKVNLADVYSQLRKNKLTDPKSELIKAESSKRVTSIAAWGAGCFVGCGGCAVITKLGFIPGAVVDCLLLTCGPPVAVGLIKEYLNVDLSFDKIVDFTWGKIKDLVNFVKGEEKLILDEAVKAEGGNSWLPDFLVGNLDDTGKEIIEDMVSTSLATGGTRQAWKTIRPGVDQVLAPSEFAKDAIKGRLESLQGGAKVASGINAKLGGFTDPVTGRQYMNITADAGGKFTLIDNTGIGLESLEKQEAALKTQMDNLTQGRGRQAISPQMQTQYDNLVDEAGRLKNASRAHQGVVDDLVKKGLLKEGDLVGTVAVDDARNAVISNLNREASELKEILDHTNMDGEKSIRKSMKTVTDQVGNRNYTTAADGLEDVAKKVGKSKKWIVRGEAAEVSRWRRLWANHPNLSRFIRGFGCLAAGEAAGYEAFKWYWGAEGVQSPGGYCEPTGLQTINGVPVELTAKEFEFQKNFTYGVRHLEGKDKCLQFWLVTSSDEIQSTSNRLDKCGNEFEAKEMEINRTTSSQDAKTKSASKAAGVSEDLIKSIIETESSGNRFAVNTETGATGLMQIMPYWFNDTSLPSVKKYAKDGEDTYGYRDTGTMIIEVPGVKTFPARVNYKGKGKAIPKELWFDETVNIEVGTDIVKHLLQQDDIKGCDDPLALAIGAYHGGTGAIEKCKIIKNAAIEYSTTVLSKMGSIAKNEGKSIEGAVS